MKSYNHRDERLQPDISAQYWANNDRRQENRFYRLSELVQTTDLTAHSLSIQQRETGGERKRKSLMMVDSNRPERQNRCRDGGTQFQKRSLLFYRTFYSYHLIYCITSCLSSAQRLAAVPGICNIMPEYG